MKHIAKVFLALTIASLLLVGPAATAVTNIKTTLSLSANKTQVHKGGKVDFTIKLKSKNNKCKANQPVKWYRNGVFKKTRTTNSNGVVTFTKGVKATSKYYTKYAGRKFGTHPNRKNCLASTSNTVRIKVKS